MFLPTLDALRFDTTGWTPLDVAVPHERRWRRPDAADGLSQHLFLRQPDFPSPLRAESLRDLYRAQLADACGGILEVELEAFDTLPIVRSIFKFPQQPSGMIYLASLTLPFRNFSYVIKAQCVETGVTGVRDAIVFDRELKAGRVSFDAS